MKIQTTRFGEIEVPESEVYAFPEGLLGFGDVHSFVILEQPGGGPLRWLQAVEVPALAFVVADPTLFFHDYRVGVRAEDLASIQLADLAKGVVLVILSFKTEAATATANLQGPLIFNPEARQARQLVLSDPKYTTRHPIFAAKTGKRKT